MTRQIASAALVAALTLVPGSTARAGKYVTYNGSTFGTYPLAPAAVAAPAPVRVVRPATTYVAPATYTAPATYRVAAPTNVYYVMPRRGNTTYVPVMLGGS